jgi:hypothetical protein
MNHQQMTREKIEFNNSLPNSTFGAINAMWDQSAKIFAAILDNANLLPDDVENNIDNWIPAYKINHRETAGLDNKTRTQATKITLVRLQEEHAMWLR